MSRLWLVRHAQSTANAEGWLAGHRDAPLTLKGRSQARRLRPLLAEVAPAQVLASDLARAAQTAALAWRDRQPPIEHEVGLRERDLGAWEGCPLEQLRATGGNARLLAWADGPPGGESHRMLAERALRTLAARAEGVDTLVFSHGGWIRTVVGLLDEVPHERIGRIKIANVQVVVRDVEAGRFEALLETLG
ncbi:MAG: histidine phosphatase family protein [Myxococcota bacterium]